MTVKEFFKSTAFKSLAVLLTIVILAGGLLAIFNDVLYVSEEEKFERSIAKIYGDSGASVKETLTVADEYKNNSSASVNQAYLMSDGKYLIQATGKNGYANGTITVWVILAREGAQFKGIEKVVYDSNEGQSFMNRFTEADYKQFSEHNSALAEGKIFGDGGIDVVKTGASAPFTFASLTGAVNAAVNYFKAVVLGVETEESPYLYANWVNLEESTITPNAAEKTVTYALTMKKNPPAPSFKINITVKEGKITAYTHEGKIATDDDYASDVAASLKDGTFFNDMDKAGILAIVKEDGAKLESSDLGTLTTGATRSSEVFLYAAAFALCNYDAFLYPIVYGYWITEETHTVTGNAVAYELTIKKNPPAPSFKVKVTVTDGKITAYTYEGKIATDDDYASDVAASLKDGSFFHNMEKAGILAIVKEDGAKLESSDLGTLTTGATRSSECFLYAAAYALCNYETFLAKEGGTQQ